MELEMIVRILESYHIHKDSQIIAAMHQAMGEAVHMRDAKYSDCVLEGIPEITLDCETCKEKQKLKNRKEFQCEVRTLFHVKGWDD
jgi:hypothetical protein